MWNAFWQKTVKCDQSVAQCSAVVSIVQHSAVVSACRVFLPQLTAFLVTGIWAVMKTVQSAWHTSPAPIPYYCPKLHPDLQHQRVVPSHLHIFLWHIDWFTIGAASPLYVQKHINEHIHTYIHIRGHVKVQVLSHNAGLVSIPDCFMCNFSQSYWEFSFWNSQSIILAFHNVIKKQI